MKQLKAVLSVKFNSMYSSDDWVNFFEKDLEIFGDVSGLQKYYVAEEAGGAPAESTYSKTEVPGQHFGIPNWQRVFQANME